MSVRVPRGKSDAAVKKIARKLESYQTDHPEAEIEVYRYSPASVRVRVVDPAFHPMSRSDRSKYVWPLLRQLPEETLSEVSMVLLISPDEKASSPVSQEFVADKSCAGQEQHDATGSEDHDHQLALDGGVLDAHGLFLAGGHDGGWPQNF